MIPIARNVVPVACSSDGALLLPTRWVLRYLFKPSPEQNHILKVSQLIHDWQTVVEATDYARHLYESEGFRVLHDYVIDLPEKWAGRDKQRATWMVRPAKGVGKHG